MALGTNPAFRSRSLVRSRIGAFRASDAGSNPAGSIIPEGTPLGPGNNAGLLFLIFRLVEDGLWAQHLQTLPPAFRLGDEDVPLSQAQVGRPWWAWRR